MESFILHFPGVIMVVMSGIGTVIAFLLSIISYYYITSKKRETEMVLTLKDAISELKTSMIAAATEVRLWMRKTDSRLDILETEHRIMHSKKND